MSVTNVATPAMLQKLQEQMLNKIYPIGSHFLQFAGDPEPAEAVGFNWTVDTDYTGRSLVGSGQSYAIGQQAGTYNHSHDLSEKGWAKLYYGNNRITIERTTKNIGIWGEGANVWILQQTNTWKNEKDTYSWGGIVLGGVADNSAVIPPL